MPQIQIIYLKLNELQMTEEDRQIAQIERNATSFIKNHFGRKSSQVQKAIKEAYIMILKDNIIF